MSFPRYPAYKDSGVEWLPTTPSHWQNTYLQHITEGLQTGPFGSQLHAEDYVSHGIPLVNPKHMQDGKIEPDSNVTVDRYTWERLVQYNLQEGDIVFARRGELGRCALITTKEAGWLCGTGSLRMRPRKDIIDPSYLIQQLSVVGVKEYLLLQSVGSTMDNLNTTILARMPITVPPLPEQRAIAAFLDAETARIDALVAKQEALIATLQEKRRALISHAVTKGLDPNVLMKDSGVPWLGEVPAHWEVKRLKYLGKALIGLTYDPSDIVDEQSGILVLRSSNVQGGKIVFDDNVYVQTSVPEEKITREGDILICSRNGSRALIGKNAIIGVDASGVTFGAFMTIYRSGANDYLYWMLNSNIFEFQSSTFLTSTINQLTIENLNSFQIPFPPPVERNAIALYLKGETAQIDTLIAKAEQFIALLREHRAALIAAAVTGQIDVRGYMASAAPSHIAAGGPA